MEKDDLEAALAYLREAFRDSPFFPLLFSPPQIEYSAECEKQRAEYLAAYRDCKKEMDGVLADALRALKNEA